MGLVYKCDRCNKIFNHTGDYKKHLARKNPCEIIKNKLNDMGPKCNYCNKIFYSNSNLYRHIKICKNNILTSDVYNNLLTQVQLQRKRIELLEKQGVNNYITNNITNNMTINIIGFGKEDMYKEYDKKVKYFIKKGYQCVLKLIENMHFNINKPEFHSVFISNIKDLYATIFNGAQWNIVNKSDVIDQLFDDKQYYLIDKYEEIKDTLDPQTRKKFERFIHETDEEVIQGLKNDIKLLLYNKRDIPMRTKKKYNRIMNYNDQEF